MRGNSKLTPKLAAEICGYLRRGHYKKDAAALAGIHRDTLDYWERRGRDALEQAAHPPLRDDFTSAAAHRKAHTGWAREVRAAKPYADFAYEAQLAHDAGAGWLVEKIIAHAEDPNVRNNKWTAYMTILERSRRQEWGRGSRIEHATPDGKPFQVSHTFDPSKLSDEELEALERLMERARPETQQ